MQYRSLLISGGTILTGDRGKPEAEAILISGDTIKSVGSREEVQNDPEAKDSLRLEIEGNTVLPGLTDSHLHLAGLAKQTEAVPLKGTSSMAEMLALIKDRASQADRDEWIYGAGFDDSAWPEKRLPTRQDLDALGIDNPVVISRICAHIQVANSRALKAAGLSPSTDVLYESQGARVTQTMSEHKFSRAGMAGIIRRTCLELASHGLTCGHTCGCSSYGLGEDMEVYRELKDRGILPVRIVFYSDEIPERGLVSGDGDGWLRYGGYKMYLDGSLGGRTAALTRPYGGQPENTGILNHSAGEVRETMLEMHSRGVQTQIHSIGDAATDQFIEGLKYTYEKGPAEYRGLLHRIIHLQVCRPDQIRSLLALGAVCDIQPSFVPSDIGIAGERLGEGRLSWAYAWKDMLKAGLTLTGSSDAPVESTDPFRGIWAAINRTDDTGYPEGGWRPDQKLTLKEALSIFTVNPWKAIGLSSRFGSLKKGFPADLTILDRDITKIPPSDFRDVRPILTMAGGKTSYGKLDGWPSFLE